MKNFMWSMLACSSALVAILAGCNGGASCQSFCERNQTLGCGSSSCVSACESGRTEASGVGCGSQHQRLLNCGEENACNTSGTVCRSQLAELSGCVTTFCVNNPSDPRCANP